MRIVVASRDYPPAATEGIARQRQVLAEGLAAIGYTVHVVTLGARDVTTTSGVTVHCYPVTADTRRFGPAAPVLDRPLTDAQVLAEGILDVAEREGADIIDIPLWLAQPAALLGRAPCPVVVWLQTTLLQLVGLQGRTPRVHEAQLADINRYAMAHASACIADSVSVLRDTLRLYGIPDLADRAFVVHPGLPDIAAPATARRDDASTAEPAERGHVHALVVGRLEHRKGTQWLLAVLPRLLGAVPTLRIRFVGRDNSAGDGFAKATGQSYPEVFAARYPELMDRVRFDGYLDDEALARAYRDADLLLHPALYESFGLIFVEAMRAGLPTVAFGTGGALEVFEQGSLDGGLLCAPDDLDGLITAIRTLADSLEERRTLGQAARRAFQRRFRSERMVVDTAAVYQRVLDGESGSRAAAPRSAGRCGRLFQIMEALQDRDAVSRITRTNADILAPLGGERPILALFAEAGVRAETGRLRGARFRADDAAIFHYWGFSRLEGLMTGFPGRKALHYHNITPPHFFSPRSAHYEMTSRGYAQLRRIASAFDLVIGDSTYNLIAFARHASRQVPMLCLYPVVDVAALRGASWDRQWTERLRADRRGPVWLFVGRFAPNKRQDQVMRAFNRFCAEHGGGRLVLVGDMSAAPAWVARLDALKRRLHHGDRILFVPSVSDDVLRACYRAADLFVSASEHEGFCVPLAEAMAFDVPVMALARGAVPETLGRSGVLIPQWDDAAVASHAASLLSPDTRRAVLDAQHRRLNDFSRKAAEDRLRAAVAYLRNGLDSPLFVPSGDLARAATTPERMPWLLQTSSN